MLTDGGRNSFLGEIESEPCAAQESNNQIPQISNHIGGPSWSPSSVPISGLGLLLSIEGGELGSLPGGEKGGT